MKKLAFIFICLFSLHAVVACADNERPIPESQLPAAAQQFIKQYFKGDKVALAKMESDFLGKSYDVIFSSGNEVEFDGNGNWKEINCKFSSVPEKAVPAQILKYVKTNYPAASILKIEKGKRKYEVDLSNRLELTFDMQFNLIDIDH